MESFKAKYENEFVKASADDEESNLSLMTLEELENHLPVVYNIGKVRGCIHMIQGEAVQAAALQDQLLGRKVQLSSLAVIDRACSLFPACFAQVKRQKDEVNVRYDSTQAETRKLKEELQLLEKQEMNDLSDYGVMMENLD